MPTGGDTNAITARECEKCHNEILSNLARNERRLNSHSDSLKELAKLNERALMLLENQGKMIETQGKTLEKVTERLEDLEHNQKGMQTAQDIVQAFVDRLDELTSRQPEVPKSSHVSEIVREIIKAPWFNWVIKGIVLAALLILGTALGKSMGLDLTTLFK